MIAEIILLVLITVDTAVMSIAAVKGQKKLLVALAVLQIFFVTLFLWLTTRFKF